MENWPRIIIIPFSLIIFITAFLVSHKASALLFPISATPGPTQTIKNNKNKPLNCNALTTNTNREKCKKTTEEIIMRALANEIYNSFDIKRCDELPKTEIGNCKNYIEETGIIEPLSNEEVKALKKLDCPLLKTPGSKKYCQNKLNEKLETEKLMKIIRSKDAKKCDELTIESEKRLCKKTLSPISKKEFKKGVSKKIGSKKTPKIPVMTEGKQEKSQLF